MKHTRLIMLSAAVLLLSGCLPSLNPWFEEKDVTFDKELPGTWRDPDAGPGPDGWTFTQSDAAEKYDLTITEEGKIGKFEATVFKLGDELMLDLAPDVKTLNDAQLNDAYRMTLIPGHLIFKVARTNDALAIHFLDPTVVADILDKNPGALAHHMFKGDLAALTAPTKQLQDFIRSHTKDKKLWNDPAELKRSGGKAHAPVEKK